MNYCIIRSGNKQYQVKVGTVVKLELLDAPVGPIVFDEVLLHVDGDNVEVGMPTLVDFKVYGTVIGNGKADKVQVFKYKSKSRYRKLKGHRQQYTEVKIDSLGGKPTKVASKAKPVVKAATKKVASKAKPSSATAKSAGSSAK